MAKVARPKLISFCKAIRAGTTVAELLALEQRRGIDGSYMVSPEEFDHQIANKDLEFRTIPLDPGFVCWIRHNEKIVTSAEIVQ